MLRWNMGQLASDLALPFFSIELTDLSSRNTAGESVLTNVGRLSAAVAHKCCTGMPQVVYYHRGPGTDESKTASVLGGLLGLGVKQVGIYHKSHGYSC